MNTKTHHGKDGSGAAGAAQAFDIGIAICGCGRWVELRAESRRAIGSKTGQDDGTSPRQSERSRRAAQPDAAKSPKTGDPGNELVVDPAFPPAPGSA
jgi:hypothetical protein